MGKPSTLYKALGALDRYGSGISFKLDGDTQNKSYIGSFITLATLAAALVLSSSKFNDYRNKTNPSLSMSTTYNLDHINFNYSSLYFAISFYNPLDVSQPVTNDNNNYTSIKYINQLNMTCTTCNFTKKYQMMNLCNSKTFQNVTLKSMSKERSKNLNEIFGNYSFCFPATLNGTLQDVSAEEAVRTESSFQIFIPFSTVSIEYVQVDTNTAPLPVSNSPTYNPQPAQPQPQQQGNNQPQQPGQQQGGGTTQPQQGGGNTQPQQPGQQQGGGTTQPQQGGGTQPQQGGTQPQQGGGTQPQQGGTQPQQGGTQTNTGGTQPQQGGTQPQQGGTQPQQGGTQPQQGGTQPQQGGSQPQQGGTQPKTRMLQTTTSSSTGVALQQTNQMISELLTAYRYPKMLVTYRDIEVNPANTENQIKFNYFLNILDYKDSLSGNPVVYDVYIQKHQVEIVYADGFSSASNVTDFLTVKLIERNAFDSLQNTGAYLSFKHDPDVPKTIITYILFSDVLSTFGSYYSVFTLVANILSGLYSEIFLKTRLINTIFKFVENSTDKFDALEKKRKEFYSSLKNAKKKNKKEEKKDKDKDKDNLDEHDENANLSRKEIEMKEMNEKQIEENKSVSMKIKDVDDLNNLSEGAESSNRLKGPNINLSVGKIDNKFNSDVLDYIEINKAKKKLKKVRNINCNEILWLNFCPCFVKKKRRYTILRECGKIIEKTMDISYIIKKIFELNYMQKILLNKRQRMLLPYQHRWINLMNYTESMEYLHELKDDDEDLDSKAFTKPEKISKENHLNKKIFEDFKNYYNF